MRGLGGLLTGDHALGTSLSHLLGLGLIGLGQTLLGVLLRALLGVLPLALLLLGLALLLTLLCAGLCLLSFLGLLGAAALHRVHGLIQLIQGLGEHGALRGIGKRGGRRGVFRLGRGGFRGGLVRLLTRLGGLLCRLRGHLRGIGLHCVGQLFQFRTGLSDLLRCGLLVEALLMAGDTGEIMCALGCGERGHLGLALREFQVRLRFLGGLF